MRIESAEVLGVGCELTGENTFIRLTTDSGITGLGLSGGWGYPRGVAGVLDELSSLLIGADPFRIEHLWHLSYRARPFRGNLLSAAVSAIDLALWDIKGKALGLPVWELLGGRTRDRVRLHVLVGGGTPDEVVSSVNWAVEEGFTAVKFDPLVKGYEDLSAAQLVGSACEMAAAAREAGGDEARPDLRAPPEARPRQRDRDLQRPREIQPALHRGSDPDRLDRDPGGDRQAHRRADRDGRAVELDLGVQRTPVTRRPDPCAARRRPRRRALGVSQDRGDRGGASLRGRSAQLPRAGLDRARPCISASRSRTSSRWSTCPSTRTRSRPRRAIDTASRPFWAATARYPTLPGSASASSTGTPRSHRSLSAPFRIEGLLRADGSVAAANWANGSIPSVN